MVEREIEAAGSAAPAGMGAASIAMATWAVAAVAAALAEAIVRLGARAVRTIALGLGAGEWIVFGVVVALSCYVEGYRALQKRFAPAVVARAFAAGGDGRRRWVAVLLAPLFALGLVGGDRRSRARAWRGVALIVVAVLLVRALPERGRAFVDGGVAAALTWGLVALVQQLVAEARRLRAARPPRQKGRAAVSRRAQITP